MKKLIQNLYLPLAFLCLFGMAQTAWAQGKPDQEMRQDERQKLIREYIHKKLTERLSLSAEQQKTFLPLYDKYFEEKHQLKKQENQLQNSITLKQDNELDAAFDKLISIKEEDVKLEKLYQKKFLEVISKRQLAELYKTQNQIRSEIMQEIKQRQD